jgi:hypothetical protein
MSRPKIKPSNRRSPAIAAAIAVSEGRPCVLCSGPAGLIGLYIPHDQAGHGAPADKKRHFSYAVCANCLRRHRDDVQDLVERKAMEDVSRFLYPALSIDRAGRITRRVHLQGTSAPVAG